jgi:fatty acid amide hydrolase 2
LIAQNSPEIVNKPLLGVPFTIKEMLSVEGMHSTLGSVHRKDSIKTEDASVVARIKDAGGVLLGTTNVPEVGLWFECWNKVYGTTNNPYDLNRTPGGSSGGEAAIIASSGSPFGIGSDIGGSIRIPASFCGIFGHKPSNFIVPFTGHSPLYKSNASEFEGKHFPLTVLGPLARKATDLKKIMNLIIGPDQMDRNVQAYSLSQEVVSWKDKNVFLLAAPILHACSEVDAEISVACKDAADYFKSLGAKVIDLREDIFIQALQMWFARMAEYKTGEFNSTLNPKGEISFVAEIARSFIGKGEYTLPASMMAFLEKFTSYKSTPKQVAEDLALLRSSLNQRLGSDGILIMPVHPRTAPKHKRTLMTPFDFAFTGIMNALMLPASAAPIRLSSTGLPIGIQIVAGDHQDHLCLAACEAIEIGFGGWLAPEE